MWVRRQLRGKPGMTALWLNLHAWRLLAEGGGGTTRAFRQRENNGTTRVFRHPIPALPGRRLSITFDICGGRWAHRSNHDRRRGAAAAVDVLMTRA
jgi:hypothetical protein